MKAARYGHFKTAMAIMRANRGRSLLTMLGVIVGVASVVLVVGIGEGVKQQATEQINQYSQNVITVRPGQLSGSSSALGSLGSSGVVSGELTAGDVNTIGDLSDVTASVPLMVIAGDARGSHNYAGAPIIGTSPYFLSAVDQSLQYGVFFTADDTDNNVAVLGSSAATRLFGNSVPLGRSFSLRGQQFVVRGVLDSFASTPLASSTDFNNAIFVPSGVADSLTGNRAPIYEILAKVDNSANVGPTAKQIQSSLLLSHGDSADFTVLKPGQTLNGTDNLLSLLTDLIAGVAAISLLVGGIGIMNVMLVSVTERNHEIGIRKAVGATNRQILSQFMIEASTLSVVGCVIGILASFLVDLLLRVFTSLTPEISWRTALFATLASLLVGIIFGSLPALKAARKDPITALRNE